MKKSFLSKKKIDKGRAIPNIIQEYLSYIKTWMLMIEYNFMTQKGKGK